MPIPPGGRHRRNVTAVGRPLHALAGMHIRRNGASAHAGAQPNGVDDGTRTRDDRHHKPGLYQLSYIHHARPRSGQEQQSSRSQQVKLARRPYGPGAVAGYPIGVPAAGPPAGTPRSAAIAAASWAEGPGAGTNAARR